MTTARAALTLVRRDLAVERGSRELAVAVAPFVATLVVLAGLAFGPLPRVLHATAPGLLWLVTIVAAVPLSHAVATAEHRDDTWEQLRCLLSPTAILAGKLGFVWLCLLLTWAMTAVLTGAIVGGIAVAPATMLGAALGTLGLAAVTTVFGVLTGSGARRAGLLAVLLLPVSLPALVAGSQTATPGVPTGAWLALLAGYDAVTLTAAWAVFPALLEE